MTPDLIFFFGLAAVTVALSIYFELQGHDWEVKTFVDDAKVRVYAARPKAHETVKVGDWKYTPDQTPEAICAEKKKCQAWCDDANARRRKAAADELAAHKLEKQARKACK